MRYPFKMPEILYHLEIAQPHTHRVRVEMTIPPLPGPLDLAIPAWMPGAYKLVDHARNIRRVAARPFADPPLGSGDPSPDRPVTRYGELAVERLDMHTWRVHGADNGAIVRYEVFADKLMIHEGQVNAEHAFLNGSALWLGVQGALHLPCRVKTTLPEGWKLAFALAPDGTHHLAADFDELVDAPLEAGRFASISVEAEGVTWEVVWDGNREPAGPALAAISRALPGLAREAVKLFGPAPFSRYVMFFHDCAEPGYLNGLEHRTSMAMQGPLDVVSHPEPFFTMVAHEIIHAWNGQRMAPHGLFRPGCDYFRPAHTTALWVVEGWTEYFASLLMLRAGQLDPSAYLAHLAETLDSFHRTPGRLCSTLEESSFITWNFGDDRWNGAINYYLKGLLAAFALDVEIRVATGGARSLDDVARALWTRYGARQSYAPSDVERLAAEIAATDLTSFFDLHLRSTADPDFGAIASRLGLELKITERAALGMRASGPDGAIKIEGVEAFGPAERAGLQVGDVLVALGEGQKATEDALAAVAADFRPDELLAVQFFRGDALCQTSIRIGSARRHRLIPKLGSHPLAADYLAIRPATLTV